MSRTKKDPWDHLFPRHLLDLYRNWRPQTISRELRSRSIRRWPLQRTKEKMSYFNWWNFGLCSGLLFGVTIIVYIQDHVGWGAADVILTIVMAISVVIFIVGRPFYRYRRPSGSPLTPLLQVLVAAIRKRKLPHPSSPSLLHEFPKTANNTHGRFLCHTQKLK